MSDPAPAPTANPVRRKRLLVLLTAICLLAGAAWAAYWTLHGQYHQTTDDAYVAGHVVQVTAQIAGTVATVAAVDTEFVRAGSQLVKLDETDSHIALDKAEAELAEAVRDARVLFAAPAALRAAQRDREIEVARARDDLARRRSIAAGGAIPDEEVAHAAARLASAEAQLTQAREQLATSLARIAGSDVARHPAVAAAAAKFNEAYVNHRRTSIVAPVDGVVAKRAVQPGQRVSPGGTLMAVVPLASVWVDANFKEVQLKRMRIGQPVAMHADLYGGDQTYHGRVVGMGAGTGSAFAILPAQNATGNWIKLVQRVPVRIALDPAELAAHPLRIGLSMSVDVDTSQPAADLPDAVRDAPAPAVAGNAVAMEAAERRARDIIRANLATLAPSWPSQRR